MNIYVTREGQNYGPYTPEQAYAMIAQGQLYPGDLACPEGQQQWVPLGQVLGIPPTAPPPAAAAVPAASASAASASDAFRTRRRSASSQSYQLTDSTGWIGASPK